MRLNFKKKCVYWPLVVHLLISVYLSVHFLFGFLFTFCLVFLSSLYILDINPLPDTQLTMISSHPVGCLSHCVCVFFSIQTFECDDVPLASCWHYFRCNWSPTQQSLSKVRSCTLPFHFPLAVLELWGLDESLSSIWSWFWYKIRDRDLVCPLCMDIQFSQCKCLRKLSFLQCILLTIVVWAYIWNLSRSIDLCVCFHASTMLGLLL